VSVLLVDSATVDSSVKGLVRVVVEEEVIAELLEIQVYSRVGGGKECFDVYSPASTSRRK